MDPTSFSATFKAAVAAEEHGRLADAERQYRALLAADPDHAEALERLGFLGLQAGRPEAARPLLERALALAPELPGRHRRLAEGHAGAGRWAAAAEAWQRALALVPGEPVTLIGLAEALRALDREPAAAAAAVAASQGAPADARLQARAAAVLQETARLSAAEVAIQRALQLAPAEAAFHLRAGQIRRDAGRLEAARADYRRALALDPSSAEAWLLCSELQRFEAGSPEIDRMERLLATVGDRTPAAVSLLFALAKAYDDVGDPDRAFARMERGNRLMRARLPYDYRRDETWVRRIIQTFDEAMLARNRRAGDPSELPVLILGLPRSGSTLAEQILASHPEVHGSGEIGEVGRMIADLATAAPGAADYLGATQALAREGWRRLGAASVARLQALAPDRARITNKMPGNILHIGLVHLALPNARFIHTRRDPVETCFACYRMLFRTGVAFAYDLRDLGRYYGLCHRLLQHWQSLIPERLFDLSYEGLVADQEGVSRRLVAFIGLPWDPACLEFHRTPRPVLTASGAQVRKGLAAEPSRRWRRYEKHLGPLLEELGPLA